MRHLKGPRRWHTQTIFNPFSPPRPYTRGLAVRAFLKLKEIEMKDKLIAEGVKNLHEFGYPGCTASNILTDGIYKAFFARMLEDNKGQRDDIDKVIDELLAQIA